MENEIINAKSPEVREVLISELGSLHEDISHCSDELDELSVKILDETDVEFEEKVNVARISENLTSINLWFDMRIRLVEQSLSFRDNPSEQSYYSVINDMTELYGLTAYNRDDIEEEALAAGVNEFCSKQVFISELREALMNVLDIDKRDIDENNVPDKNETESFAGRRLLLVEDNEFNREIALDILSEYGFCMEVAENGAEAVEKVAASEPGYYDLVLMDIQMPVMDGYEATRTIRKLSDPQKAGITIVAMTANAFDIDKRNAYKAGMNWHIAKPIKIDELMSVLTELLKAGQC